MQPLWVKEYKKVRGSKLTTIYEEPARSYIKYTFACPQGNCLSLKASPFFLGYAKAFSSLPKPL